MQASPTGPSGRCPSMHCGGRGATSNAAAGFCAEMCACRSGLIPRLWRPRFHVGDPAMKHLSPTHFGATPRVPAILPNRPDARVLNRAIPLFFIGRNKNGFWLAREAQGRIGGMFLLRRSALRFAQEASAPHGCATMFIARTFELDTWNLRQSAGRLARRGAWPLEPIHSGLSAANSHCRKVSEKGLAVA